MYQLFSEFVNKKRFEIELISTCVVLFDVCVKEVICVRVGGCEK